MSPDGTKPPPFYCPSCGKKHRADLSGLIGHEGAHAKVTCHRCDSEMTLFLGSDGLPKCEIRGAATAVPGAETSSPAAAAVQPAASGGSMPASNWLVLVASALVAGVVSFAAVNLGGGGGPPEDDARIVELEQALTAARAEIAELRGRKPVAAADIVADVERKLQPQVDSMQKSLDACGASVEQLSQLLQERVTRVAGDYKALNGRIEANYQKGRELDKRLKAVEGN